MERVDDIGYSCIWISKHDDESATSVRTIRRNLKDMSTADKAQITTTADDNDDATTMDQQQQQPSSTVSPNDSDSELDTANVGSSSANGSSTTSSAMARFGGSTGDNDWSEFAEEENDNPSKTTTSSSSDKPKYTFGATSGFGTKGWAASQQTTPSPLSTNTTQKVNANHVMGLDWIGLDCL